MACGKIDMELAVNEVYIDTGSPENSYIRVSTPFNSTGEKLFYWSSTYNEFIEEYNWYWPDMLENVNLNSNISVGDLVKVVPRDVTITDITESYGTVSITVSCDRIQAGTRSFSLVYRADIDVYETDYCSWFLPNDHTYVVGEIVYPQRGANFGITGYHHMSEPKVKVNGIEILPGETRKFRKGKELLVDARMGSTKQFDNFNLTADTSYDVEMTSIEPDVWVHHGLA